MVLSTQRQSYFISDVRRPKNGTQVFPSQPSAALHPPPKDSSQESKKPLPNLGSEPNTSPIKKPQKSSSTIPTHPKMTLGAYLARSSLRQLRSWAEVRVVACVRWACWKWPARRLASTAFLHMSSSGTLACAPTSFRATSDSTLRPSASTSTHIMQPSSWEGKPMICGDSQAMDVTRGVGSSESTAEDAVVVS